LPDLLNENVGIYEVYWRVFNTIKNIDAFRVMDMVGIKEEDQLSCLDLIQHARNEVMRIKLLKGKA